MKTKSVSSFKGFFKQKHKQLLKQHANYDFKRKLTPREEYICILANYCYKFISTKKSQPFDINSCYTFMPFNEYLVNYLFGNVSQTVCNVTIPNVINIKNIYHGCFRDYVENIESCENSYPNNTFCINCSISCENCYMCVDCVHSFSCYYSQELQDCTDCKNSRYLRACNSCKFCENLYNCISCSKIKHHSGKRNISTVFQCNLDMNSKLLEAEFLDIKPSKIKVKQIANKKVYIYKRSEFEEYYCIPESVLKISVITNNNIMFKGFAELVDNDRLRLDCGLIYNCRHNGGVIYYDYCYAGIFKNMYFCENLNPEKYLYHKF